MYFHDFHSRSTKQLLPGVLMRAFWGEKMLLSLVELHPHAVIPLHSHPHEQVGMCLTGEFSFTIGEETRMVKPGDVWVIPGGVEHSVTMGDAPGRVVEVFSPVREEYKY